VPLGVEIGFDPGRAKKATDEPVLEPASAAPADHAISVNAVHRSSRRAEEQIFYPTLLSLGQGAAGKPTAADETKDAIKDHNEFATPSPRSPVTLSGARAGTRPLTRPTRRIATIRAKRSGRDLSDFRTHSPLQLRHDLAIRFAVFDAVHITGVEPVDKIRRATSPSTNNSTFTCRISLLPV
jgi:hypothetical protein